MSKTSKYVHIIESGDLILVASSKQTPNDWTEAALFVEGEVLHTIHTQGHHKTIMHTNPEFLEHEARPTGLFRLGTFSKEERRAFAFEVSLPLKKEVSFFQKIKSLFTSVPRQFNWENRLSIRLLLLEYFNSHDLKKLEESGSLIRLL
jgi:hypothetical protein